MKFRVKYEIKKPYQYERPNEYMNGEDILKTYEIEKAIEEYLSKEYGRNVRNLDLTLLIEVRD